MTLQELELRLSRAKILRALTYPGLRRVARNGRVLNVSEGQMVIGPKLGGTSCYVVLDGSIEVVMPWGPIMAYLGPGDIFGEMALLDHAERNAYCKAKVETLLFEIPFHVFHSDLLGNPVVRGGLEEMALARRRIQLAIRRHEHIPAPEPPMIPEQATAGEPGAEGAETAAGEDPPSGMFISA